MAWTATRKQFGVCGNFKFKFFTITDAQNTKSIVKTGLHGVKFVGSTDTVTGTELMKAKPLLWTGTSDTNTPNELEDGSETFVKDLEGLNVHNTTDKISALITKLSGTASDRLEIGEPDCNGRQIRADTTDQQGNAAPDTTYDAFPDGNETFQLNNDSYIMLTPTTADDDGAIIVIGD